MIQNMSCKNLNKTVKKKIKLFFFFKLLSYTRSLSAKLAESKNIELIHPEIDHRKEQKILNRIRKTAPLDAAPVPGRLFRRPDRQAVLQQGDTPNTPSRFLHDIKIGLSFDSPRIFSPTFCQLGRK